MFSTIKSRVLVLVVTVMVFTIAISFTIGSIVQRNIIEKEMSTNADLAYKIDTAEDLNTLAEMNEFDYTQITSMDEIYNKDGFNQKASLLSSLVLGVIGLTIIFLVVINITFDWFIKPALNVSSDSISDFDQVKYEMNSQNELIAGTENDLLRVNSFINHELKNSLAILKAKSKFNPDQMDDYIDELNNQIDDLNALTLNRLENAITIDLLLVLAELVDDEFPQVELNFDDGDFEIIGNVNLVKRAFYNIIQNAFKYGASKVEIEVYNLENSVVAVVKNNGDEIAKNEIDKIFDYRYRIKNLNADGSGIGLALVMNIMKILKGSIYVESNPEQTSFYLAFPNSQLTSN